MQEDGARQQATEEHELVEDEDSSSYDDENTNLQKRLLDEPSSPVEPPVEMSKEIPWRVYILAMVTYYLAAVDLLSYTIIQPFLPQYLREKFPDLPKENIGSITGWVLGCFFIARFFSNTVIGHISDLYGRKWPLILSMLVSTIATGVFTFLDTIWLLILVRVIHGFLSATSALAKAQLVDVSTGHNIPTATRSLLFAYLGSTFAMSRATSSAMGGIIVGIGTAVKSNHPYLIACLTATVIIGIGLIFSVITPETHTPSKHEDVDAVEDAKSKQSVFAKLRALFGDRTRLKLFAMFLLNSMNNASCFVIWVLVSQESVNVGGFGFDSLKTGIMFAIYGFFAVGFQIFFFKKVMTKFNLLTTFRIGSIFQMMQNSLFGALMLINAALEGTDAQPYVLWLLLTIFCWVTAMGFMMTLNVLQSMIVNATDQAYQGLVQGVSESIATAARALGPIIFGFCFSLFLKHFATPLPVFAMLVALYGTSLFISLFLNKELVNN